MIQTHVTGTEKSEKNEIEDILLYPFHFKDIQKLLSTFINIYKKPSEVHCQYEFRLNCKSDFKYFTKVCYDIPNVCVCLTSISTT